MLISTNCKLLSATSYGRLTEEKVYFLGGTMTKLELANQLIKQLQEQNSSNLDMIDKLQQQVQVQQTWFQWAVGIFITIAIVISGLTWASVHAENKRSREEIINLKEELGIDSLSKIVDEQTKKYEEIKGYTNKWEESTKTQTSYDFAILLVEMTYMKMDSYENVFIGMARISGVIDRLNMKDVPDGIALIFIKRIINLWGQYTEKDDDVVELTIKLVDGVLTDVGVKFSKIISKKFAVEYQDICKKSAEMMKNKVM